ncbi:hypothetical protein [Hymenobacter arizonensis]|uniref:Uncharacterized protein n=1 Tax=Hymenobacter arizonensis TaxID=1227077 RepID=A0A1I6BT37_HYMAR|nr:hypothetical protein [Hymenobacter arizonensis]SFQ84082.1 hypothetical protein SAMN04515668_5074 [Hymenobacter arizonensis]
MRLFPMTTWGLWLFAFGCLGASCARPRARPGARSVGVVRTDALEDSLAATLARLRRLTPHVVLVRRANLLGYSISATLLWQLPDGKSFAQTFRDDVPATRHASAALDTLFSFYRQQPLGP